MQHAFYLRTNAMLLREVLQAAPLQCEKKNTKQTLTDSSHFEDTTRFSAVSLLLKRVFQTHYKCLGKADETINQELIKLGLGKGFLCAFNYSWRTSMFFSHTGLLWPFFPSQALFPASFPRIRKGSGGLWLKKLLIWLIDSQTICQIPHLPTLLWALW